MSEVYPLDMVIRKVSSKTKAINSAQKIVIIDINTGKEKRSFFATDTKHFLVLNTRDEKHYANRKRLICNVADFDENDLSFDLCVDYQVTCDPEQEVKVAEALWNNNHPGAELDRKIRKYIDNFFNFENDFSDSVNDFKSVIKRLKKYIKENINSKIGLNVTRLNIKLEIEDELTPLRIISSYFPVQFSDYPEELDLQFKIELLNDEDREANAIFLSKDTDSLEKAIQKEIKKYLLENISIEQFYGELNTLVRTKLISHLNTNILSRYGRKMNYLSLNSTAISTEVKSFLEIEHQVKHQVQEEIIINNNVQMTPNNIGKYRAYGSPNLDVWVRENLDIVIKSTLFEESYVDILSDFSSIRKTIKNQMVLLAESIGYTVKQIVSKPENETLELTKYFALNVKV